MSEVSFLIQQAIGKVAQKLPLDDFSGISDINEILIVEEMTDGKYRLSFRPTAQIKALKEAELIAFCHDLKAEITQLGFKMPDDRINRIPGTLAQGFYGYLHPLKGNPRHEFFDMPFPEQEGIVPNGTYHGWMLTDLIRKESFINGRWNYWHKVTTKQTKVFNPDFLDFGSEEETALGMLEHCLDMITEDWRIDGREKWAAIKYLFDWLLWSIGNPLVEKFPEESDYLPYAIDSTWDGLAHNRLYQVFDVNYLLLFPDDYFGLLLYRLSDELKKYNKPLPFDKLNKWVLKEVQNGSINENELFLDPCVESGRMLLAASNHSYNLGGLSDNELLAKAAIINFYLYAPWALANTDWNDVNRDLERVLRTSKRIAKFKNRSIDSCLLGKQFQEGNYSPLILLMDAKEDMFAALQPGAEPDMFAALQPGAEPDIFAALQPAAEPDMFQALQPGAEPDMFQALQPAAEPDMFQALQPGAEPDMFAALQPAAEPDMFQALQPAAEPDMFQALQPAAEPDMFQALQPGEDNPLLQLPEGD